MKKVVIILIFFYPVFLTASETDTTTWNGKNVTFLAGEILVGLQSWADEGDIASTLSQINGVIIKDFDQLNIGLIKIQNNNNIHSAINSLKYNAAVLYAEPNIEMSVLSTYPNDPYYVGTAPPPYNYAHQWGLYNFGQNPPTGRTDADIDAPEAWDYETGSSSIKIAVFDSGIPMIGDSLSHPDLDDVSRIIIGEDFTTEQNTVKDSLGHGTHVAGIIGAETNNNEGIAGVAHGCKIIIFQTVAENGYGTVSSFYDAVIAAVDSGVQVINFSGGWVTYEETIKRAVEYADNAGIVQIYAAGNEAGDGLRFPARFAYGPKAIEVVDSVQGSLHLLQNWNAYGSVISVASTNSYDAQSSFSSYDPDSNYISVAAPGGEGSGCPSIVFGSSDIFSTTPNYPFAIQQGHPEVSTSYGYLAGTSMAAPHVAGIAGLILSRFTTLSASDVRNVIEKSAEDVNWRSMLGFDKYLGHGRVNAFYAVAPPVTPSNFSGTWYNTHPKISWNSNIEPDLKHYLILKNNVPYITTTNNYYIDFSESQYSIGNPKVYVSYKVKAVDITDQSSNSSTSLSFAINGGIEKKEAGEEIISEAIDSYGLFSNYPNPFNPSTQIVYQIPKEGFVNLTIYNTLGQVVQTLVNKKQTVGKYTVEFNANNLPSGVYIFKLQADEFSSTKKMVIAK